MVDNAAIAELLICEAETAEGHREQAFRRAAHAAFMWPEEGMDIAAAGRALTELAGIGHSLAKRLHNWIGSHGGRRPDANPVCRCATTPKASTRLT